MNEEWRPISDFPRYQVSNLGRVKGVTRILTLQEIEGGYQFAMLRLEGSRRLYRCRVGRLVATAFHGDAPPGYEAAHLDNNPRNNRADNLAWTTHLENESHKFRHGTNPAGDRHPQRKLSSDQVVAVRKAHAVIRLQRGRRAPPGTLAALAEKFGIKPTHVAKIVGRGIWRHLP